MEEICSRIKEASSKVTFTAAFFVIVTATVLLLASSSSTFAVDICDNVICEPCEECDPIDGECVTLCTGGEECFNGVCSECNEDADCTAPLSECFEGTCRCPGDLECCSDSDCPSGEICDTADNMCDEPPSCTSDSDCMPSICDTSSGKCVPCTDHDQCSSGFCNKPFGVCGQCTADAQCLPFLCDESSGACVKCTADAQCLPFLCDESSGACGQRCTANGQCPSGFCDESSGKCTKCDTKDDCAPDEFCNPEIFECEKIPQPVDLTIANMEITQGIQNFANTVPLVQNKTTYVRVYPRVDIADRRVEARLRGFRDGIEFSDSPLRPVYRFVTVQTAGASRATLKDSFNFWVPPAWQSGTVTFQAEINFDGVIPETNKSNNTLRLRSTFTPKPPVCVLMVPVLTQGPSTYTVNDPGFDSIIARFKSLWPVPEVNVFYLSKPISKRRLVFPIPPTFESIPYQLPKDDGKLLKDLRSIHFFTTRFFTNSVDCPRGSPRRTVGMVNPNINTGAEAGAAWSSDPVSWVKMVGGFSRGVPGSFNTPQGGVTMAHELVHNFGDKDRWNHVNCGGPDFINRNYPYPTNQIGPNLPDAFWGFDPLTDPPAIISPTGGRDFMSYCGPEWVSNYTWENIFNEINLRNVVARSLEPANALVDLNQSAEILVVSGVITPATNVAIFDYGYRLSQDMVSTQTLEELQPNQDAPTTYKLELLDASGIILFSVPFEPIKAIDGTATDSDEQGFFLTVPFDPKTARVRITRNGQELRALTVSAHAPQVTLLQPTGGEMITEPLTIRWEASDQDDDPLLYTIQYSPDLGASWQALAVQTPETTLTLDDTLNLPGSDQALIRVIASDGINTNSATSGPFTLQSHAPVVHIDTPGNQDIFALGSQIILMGGARDAEDGSLSDEALTWLVNDQLMGSGKEIALNELAPGPYNIVLEAVDSDNNKATASVTITVVNDMPVAGADSYSTPENTPLVVDAPGVLGNDIDAEDDPLIAVLVSDVGNGALNLNADGSFTYTPNTDFSGVDSFTYKANDGATDSNVVTVNLTTGNVSVRLCPDADGDGSSDAACGGTDCDDTDADINPEAAEICTDGIDEDCDGFIDCDDPDCVEDPVCIPPPVKCSGRTATIIGTLGDDVLPGTSGPDVIHGLGGNDTINGFGGKDIICGGRGNDTLRGMSGRDTIRGGDGNDNLFGGADNDTLRGGSGNDALDGVEGDDLCNGGAGGGDTAIRCETVTNVP